MIDPEWKNDPLLATMSPAKLNFLVNAIDRTNNMTQEELSPYFFSVITNANKQNITFNDAETALILRVLSSGMNAAERKRMEKIQQMTNIISRSKKNK